MGNNEKKMWRLQEVTKETGIPYMVLWRMIQKGEIKARRYHVRGFWYLTNEQVEALR